MMDRAHGSDTSSTSEIALLRSAPFDWLASEYDRLKWACVRLQAVLYDADLPVSNIVTWLQRDVLMHIAEERDHLLPLLLGRTPEGEDVSALAELLGNNYRLGEAQAQHVLEMMTDFPVVPMAIRDDILNLAARERQHLALFSAIGLPLLRLRVPVSDLSVLSRRLAAGRGWVMSNSSLN